MYTNFKKGLFVYLMSKIYLFLYICTLIFSVLGVHMLAPSAVCYTLSGYIESLMSY